MSKRKDIVGLVASGDTHAGLSKAQAWVKDEGVSADAWLTYSEVCYTLKAYSQALAAARRALALSSGVVCQINLAKCLAASGLFAESLSVARTLMAVSSLSGEAFSVVSNVFAVAGLHEEALDAARHAVEKAPKDVIILYNLAMAERACGLFSSAIGRLNQVIALTPQDWLAYKNRSDLKKWTNAQNNIAELEAICPREEDEPEGYVLVSAALAKEYADISEHKQSFAYLKRGADARRRQFDYDVAHDVQIMQTLAAEFSKSLLQKPSHAAPEGLIPVFIVGLPRAGSTLLERIIAASGQVQAMGELADFPKAVTTTAAAQYKGQQFDQLGLVKRAPQLDFETLGRQYLERVMGRGIKSGHFIDKLPMNFLNIGLIHMALPHAKVIHIAREPMAACYSVYKNFFGDGHPYSYDLQELADYYEAYYKLMEYWQATLPKGRVLNVSYEDLVTAPDAVGKRVFDYIGVPWSADYLAVDVSKTPTATASAVQVHEPIHTDAMTSWKHVEAPLQPLRTALKRADLF